MKIKVCGNTIVSQVRELDKLAVDFAGFIFYKQSPRYMGEKIVKKEIENLPAHLKKVGVFVNESRDQIMKIIDEYQLDAVQLHGDETPEFCKQISDHISVIKAFRIGANQIDIDWMLKEYVEVCDFYLFDKQSRSVYGGSGEKFDWNLLQKATIGKNFFLSGGICENDVKMLQRFTHRYFYGIDINSCFEKSPGIKDIEKLKNFVNDIRHADVFQNAKKEESCGQ